MQDSGSQGFEGSQAVRPQHLSLNEQGAGDPAQGFDSQGVKSPRDSATPSGGYSRNSAHSGAGYPRDSAHSGGYPRDSTPSSGYPRDSSNSGGYPRDSTPSSGYPRDSSNSGGYPRDSTNSGGYPRDSTNFGGYPRDSTNSDGYPRDSTNSGGYPRDSTNSGGYPRDSTNSGGYPRDSTNSGGYPRDSTNSGGYPRDSTNSGGYPRNSAHSGGYPKDSTNSAPSSGYHRNSAHSGGYPRPGSTPSSASGPRISGHSDGSSGGFRTPSTSAYLEPVPYELESGGMPGLPRKTSPTRRRGHPPEHDSGVDIDHAENGHHDNRMSDVSSRSSSVQFHPEGAVGWGPGGQPSLAKHVEGGVGGRPDSLAYRSHDYEELPINSLKFSPVKQPEGYVDMDEERGGSGSGAGQVPVHPAKLSGNARDSGTSERIRRDNGNRRRRNPLYDSMMKEDSRDGTKPGAQCTRCICILLILVSAVASLALVLAILTYTGTAAPERADLNHALTRIRSLENQYEGLLQQYEILLSVVGDLKFGSSNDTTLVDAIQALLQHRDDNDKVVHRVSEEVANVSVHTSQLRSDVNALQDEQANDNEKITNLEMSDKKQNETLQTLRNQAEDFVTQLRNLSSLSSDVQAIKQNLSEQTRQVAALDQQLRALETDVYSEIGEFRVQVRQDLTTISKMPGPPGPPGAGDLTQCSYTKTSNGGAAANPQPVHTIWIPQNATDAESQVFMGLECSTPQGEQSVLETREAPFRQYRCSCYGNRNPTNTVRHCELYYWKCPAHS